MTGRVAELDVRSREGAAGHRGPGPRSAVGLEVARALSDGLLLPLRVLGYAARRRRYLEEVRADLLHPASLEEPPPVPSLPARALHVFVSCAEPSGELHGANLIRALRCELAAAGAPAPRFSGLGGGALQDLGVETLADPVARAAMGADVLRSVPWYLGLLTRTARFLRDADVDLVLPVDSPALHVPLAHLARRYRIPVVHFATPQYWAWAPWRVSSYRRAVDLGLSILPFEPPWFARHRVRTAYVGHPLLDEIEAARRTRPGAPAGADAAADPPGELAILPGSRTGVIDRNLPWMIAAVGRLRSAHPDVEVVLPHDRPELEGRLREHVRRAGAASWIRIETGGLHATLARARTALSVSGTILIDLLAQRVPTVVVYRLSNGLQTWLSRRALTVPWFSSVNLLAAREVLPEFCFHGQGPLDAVVASLARLHGDGAWRQECLDGLETAAGRLGAPGATRRAARRALELVGGPCSDARAVRARAERPWRS